MPVSAMTIGLGVRAMRRINLSKLTVEELMAEFAGISGRIFKPS